MPNLERFTTAQDAGSYQQAVNELASGGKRGHWIWYIFPQLSGLGRSYQSEIYGIEDAAEAAEYLRHPILATRLLSVTTVLLDQLGRENGPDLVDLMGSRIDALKLVSSATLFHEVATRMAPGEQTDVVRAIAAATATVLQIAARQGYPECRFTLDGLRSRP